MKTVQASAFNFLDDFSFSTVAVAQWARHWDSGHKMEQAVGSSPGGDVYQFFQQ